MSEQKESSVLFNLKELMNLEEDRIADEEAEQAATTAEATRKQEEDTRLKAEAEAAAQQAELDAVAAAEKKTRDDEERVLREREEALSSGAPGRGTARTCGGAGAIARSRTAARRDKGEAEEGCLPDAHRWPRRVARRRRCRCIFRGHQTRSGSCSGTDSSRPSRNRAPRNRSQRGTASRRGERTACPGKPKKRHSALRLNTKQRCRQPQAQQAAPTTAMRRRRTGRMRSTMRSGSRNTGSSNDPLAGLDGL